jgi:hypothetical protein
LPGSLKVGCIIDLYCRHHASVLMLKNVAMEHKSANLDRVCEGVR